MKRLIRSGLVMLTAWSLAGIAGTATAGMLEFEFDAANFPASPTINPLSNQFWPGSLGPTFVYYAESEDGCAINQVTVTGGTRSGFAAPYHTIEAWEVEDLEWLSEECDGTYALMEETVDWFAQDNSGNVWYFGEDTTAYDDDDECPSDSGAWEAGDDFAEAGVVMPAQPVLGAWYQQEYYEDEAEDRARALKLDASVDIEYGSFAGCLRTKEYTPLEAGEIEHKNYCPPYGLMLINELKGKTVRVEYIGSALPDGDFATEGVCPPSE